MEQELEFILRDILDDLKALRVNNSERQSESVKITNRLDTFEKLLKEQKETACTINTKPFEDIISKELFQLRNFITAENANKRIIHKRYLHKRLFALLMLTLLCVLLSFGWYNSYETLKQLKANDIKYRALKVTAEKSLLKLLYHTDSLYLLDSDSFEVKVKKLEHLKN